MQAGDFFIQRLGKDIDAGDVILTFGPQLNLGQNLIGEGGRHHKGRVARGIAKVQKAAFGQQDQTAARGHLDHIHLFFDVGPFVVAQRGDLNFVVEMADVANDGHVLHLAHVFDADDVAVAGGGDEDVGAGDFVFQEGDFITVHRGLQGADRVHFGDLHAGACAAQRGGGAFAHVAVAADHGDLAGHHGVGGAADAVDQRFLAAVFVVEL